MTAFTSSANAHLYENYLRFAFCKDNEIDEAAKRLEKVSLVASSKKENKSSLICPWTMPAQAISSKVDYLCSTVYTHKE